MGHNKHVIVLREALGHNKHVIVLREALDHNKHVAVLREAYGHRSRPMPQTKKQTGQIVAGLNTATKNGRPEKHKITPLLYKSASLRYKRPIGPDHWVRLH